MSFKRGALILAGTSALSYLFGLLRDRVLAGTFGASDALDVYQAAFIVPDFLFSVFIAGALSAAFIPVFTSLKTHGKHKQAAQLAGSIVTLGLGLLILAAGTAFLLAEPLATLVGPGFADAKQASLAGVTRIMLLSPSIFLISNLLGGMLISTKRFLFYGLSPALYNLGIILGAVFLAPQYGIHGVAIGTIIGAILHLSVRFIDVRRAKLRVIPSLNLTPNLRKVFKLMLPRMVGLASVQVQLWAFIAIASTLGEGAVSIYSLARNFQSFPVSLIGIAFATSLFPLLAESASLKEQKEYSKRLLHGALVTLGAVIPTAVVIFLLRHFIIDFFIGTGAFDAAAISLTATVLGVYTLSIPTESLVHILARAFYALHNTLIPVTISLISIAVSISSSYVMAQSLGIVGIPAGFAIGTGLQAGLLLIMLRLRTSQALAKISV